MSNFAELFSENIQSSFSKVNKVIIKSLRGIDCSYSILFEYPEEEIAGYYVDYKTPSGHFFGIGFIQLLGSDEKECQLTIHVPVNINEIELIKYIERNRLREIWEERKQLYHRYKVYPPGSFDPLWVMTKRDWENKFSEDNDLENLLFNKLFPGKPLNIDEKQRLEEEFGKEMTHDLSNILDIAFDTEKWADQYFENNKEKVYEEYSNNQLQFQVDVLCVFIDALRWEGIWSGEGYGEIYSLHEYYDPSKIEWISTKRGPTEIVKKRALLFSTYKKQHPDWTQQVVAQRVQDIEFKKCLEDEKASSPNLNEKELKKPAMYRFINKWGVEQFTEEHVRMAYRAMGWTGEWIRGTRSR